MQRRRWSARAASLGCWLLASPLVAQADSVDMLREFVRDVKSGRSAFTQVVTSADGKKQKTSSGSFEFQRPGRFRFAYSKPFEQVIVSDGVKVWIYDADLNQASSRPLAQALGSTPAALLTGGNLDLDFKLTPEADAAGQAWVRAEPKAKDQPFQSMRVGFKGKDLATVEITDSFGQKSLLQFTRFEPNVALDAERFRFKAPAGADVIAQ